MSNFYASYPFEGGGGGVTTYANFAAFPSAVAAGNGALAIALDTDILYVSTGAVWEVLADPAVSPFAITALTGDGTATGPGSVPLTLATVNSNVGSFGSSTNSGAFTVNAKGLVTAASSPSIQIAESQVTNLVTDLAGKVPTTRTISTTAPLTGGGDLSANRTFAITSGNLTDVGTDGITVTGGTGAVLGSGTSIAQTKADATHNGYLSSGDWSTFNSKQNALTLGNLTGSGMVITGGTGAVVGSGAVVAMPVQHDIWVDRNGSDTTGTGTMANPFQTVGKALTLVVSPTQNNNYSIHLMSGRHDQETGDLALPPWTWIVGSGGPNFGSYLRLPGGNVIKNDSTWTTNARGGLQSVYLGGTTSISLDFISVGGFVGSNFVLDDCTVGGSITHTGRNASGGDFLYLQNTFVFGDTSFTSSAVQGLNFSCQSVTATTNANNGSAITFVGGQVSGNFSFTNGGLGVCSLYSSGVSYAGSFTTTGTIALSIDSNLPPGFSLSGGTTRTPLTNAFSESYTPTTSANWNSVPAATGGALDTLASSGVVKSQTTNKVLASPSGSSGVPSFRALVTADLPAGTGTVTSVALSGGTTGLTSSGGPITTSGTITLAGTLAIANGGTGQTAKTAAFDALSPTTTKGDLIVSNGTNNIRVGVGSNNQVLTADSAQASGVKWGAVLSNPMTTTGDIIYSSDNSGTPARLAVGTAIQALMGGTTPSYGQLYQNYVTASSAPSGTTTLTTTSSSVQVLTPSVDINLKVDNSFLAGQRVTVVNQSTTKVITIVANDSSVIRTVYPSTTGEVICNTSSPADSTKWNGVGIVQSNWASYTLTIGAASVAPTPGTSTSNAQWRRNGQSMEIHYQFVQSVAGSSGTGEYQFPIPSGFSIDTSIFPGGVGGGGSQGICGSATARVTALHRGGVVIVGTSSYLQIFQAGPDLSVIESGSFGLNNATIVYAFTATVPISGWTATTG